jgi:hypothetical protein
MIREILAIKIASPPAAATIQYVINGNAIINGVRDR